MLLDFNARNGFGKLACCSSSVHHQLGVTVCGLEPTSSTVTARVSTRCREPRHAHAHGHAQLLVSRYIGLQPLTQT